MKAIGKIFKAIVILILLFTIVGLFLPDDETGTGNTTDTKKADTTKADPLSGFTEGWCRYTKRDATFYLYDPKKQIIVICWQKSDDYLVDQVSGDLETGLHTVIGSDGSLSGSYYIYKTILKSKYVAECEADGSYDEYDLYSIDLDDGLRYLRKTSYIKDHQ